MDKPASFLAIAKAPYILFTNSDPLCCWRFVFENVPNKILADTINVLVQLF